MRQRRFVPVASQLALGALLWLAACTTVPSLAPDEGATECAGQLSPRGSARPLAEGLASNRFLASFVDQNQRLSAAQRAAWLARSRALALNDGSAAAGEPVLDECWSAWRGRAVQAWSELAATASVDDEYSFLQRLLGAYPVAVVGLRLGINDFKQKYLQRWSEPVAISNALDYRLPVSQQPGAAVTAAKQLRNAPRDALGVPEVSVPLARALATEFAPRFLVQQRGPADEIGQVQLQPGPAVDSTQPTLSWRLDFSRAHGEVLTQISWLVWFDERPPEGHLDWYAGALDGLVWRASFGPDGWPVAFDTIHPCGCYHFVFPTRHEALAAQQGFWEEARLQPQAPVPWATPTLILEAGTHYLRAVKAGDAALASVDQRELRLETWLETRRRLEPALRSDGVLRGSERLERWWLWPSGVRSPGAMRDWGRHATAFVGRQHFDEARVLEPYLEPGLFNRDR